MTSAGLKQVSRTPAVTQPKKMPAWVKELTADIQAELLDPATRLNAIAEIAQPLELAETAATTTAVTESLDAEGFMTRMMMDGGVGFVEGRRGNETILVEVQGARIERDRAGLDDETCTASDTAFETQMAARGFHLVTEHVTEHRNVPGGALIRAAARQNRRNLAEGAAKARRVANPGAAPARRVVA
jgi:hypothetical protein